MAAGFSKHWRSTARVSKRPPHLFEGRPADSSPLSRHRRLDEIDHPDHKLLAGASEQEMISAFDYDQTLRDAGRLVELAPLIDRDDRVARSMRDQGRAFHTGHFARRLEAVLRQEMQ